MRSLASIADSLQTELTARAAARGVPGATVAVVADGQVLDAATGVLSTATGVEATTDSVFQIGSITKVWTATLVMQLVDEGLVALDEPLRTYLPEFAIADEAAASAITVRQLLSHRAGFEGDIFTDTGRGDDAVAAYVDTLSGVAQIFPPGAYFSYNNAGYIVLGRLVERLRDTTWDQAVLDRIATPLGLERVSPSPYEAILHRVAVGHIGPGDDGVEVPAPMWALARSNAPAGSMLAMTARDLANFALMHLTGGSVGGVGAAVLSPESVRAMQRTEVALPTLAGMGVAWGLGWEIYADSGSRIIGHDGNTIGQASFLRLVPDAGVAITLLTNGGDGMGLLHDIADPLLHDLAGVDLPRSPTPPAEPIDVNASPFVGTYSNTIVDLVVSLDDGRIWLEQHPKGMLADLKAASRDELVALSPNSLILREPTGGLHPVFAFLDPDAEGRPTYMHYGRAIPRSADADAPSRTARPIAAQEESQ